MPQLINSKTNAIEDLPYNNAAGAFISGSHNLVPNAPVPLVDPQGNVFGADPNEVYKAITQGGYAFASPQQIKEANFDSQYGDSVTNSIKAFGLGAARGASFGLSDQFLTKSGLVQPDTISELEKRHEIASPAGEIAGVLGSEAIAPNLSPASLVAKAGKAAEKATASTLVEAGLDTLAHKYLPEIAGKTAGAAITGAAYGAGNVLTEQALGDPALVSEGILSQIGQGALFGGAFGAALGIADKSLPPLMEGTKKFLASGHEALFGEPGESAGLLGKGFAKAASVVSGDASDEIESLIANRADLAATKGASLGASEIIGPAIAGKIAGPTGILAVAGYDALKNYEQTVQRLAKLENASQKAFRAIDKGVNSIFKAASPIAEKLIGYTAGKLSKEDQEKDFDKHVNELQELSQPEKFMAVIERATQGLEKDAPEIAGQLSLTAANALSFLSSKIPQKPEAFPLSNNWKASNADIAKFNKYYEAVENPIDSLKQIKSGTLSKESTEALVAVYPVMYNHMKQELMQSMTALKTPPNYQTKMMLSIFFGQPMNSSLKPGFIAMNQQAMQGPTNQSGENVAAPRKSSQTGLSKLSIAERSLTPMQKANQRIK